ncbi:MAG: hypothetical protein LBT93_02025 [Treponema sp.]|jgi:hypothetical protein|nr:hypothetical protein [Treponema sp.]
MKNNKFFMTGMLVLALVFGLLPAGCGDPDSGDPSGGAVGSFRIRITGIPEDVMAAGASGTIIIGMAPPNTLIPNPNDSGAIAGRILAIESDADDFGTDWYEFDMYDAGNYSEVYVGPAGSYDIGFMIVSISPVAKIIRSHYLEVNKTNEIAYSSFKNFQ